MLETLNEMIANDKETQYLLEENSLSPNAVEAATVDGLGVSTGDTCRPTRAACVRSK